MQRRELADGQHQADAAELAEARVLVGANNLFEPIEERQLQDNRQIKRQTQNAASVLKFGAAGTMMQTKMTNADKTIRQNMRKKAANELHRRESHQFCFAIVAVIEILESDRIFANGDNAMIGNGNTENIASQIFNQLFFVIERRLDIDFPIFRQTFREHSLNIQPAVIGIEFAVCPELRDSKTETIAELIGKQFDGEEELMVSGIPSVTSGRGHKRAARDDEVDVEMLLHALTPSVHDHRKADFTAEILLSELLQELRGSLDEQVEQ